ncbi:MAG TPA: hypothetical protein VN888_27245 [Mycobacterium sp.]|nr:hypothetical protein [Mycobacterium sp.]
MFIFVATNTVRHRMLSQERRRAPKWVDYIDLHEPRHIAFLEYLSEDGTEVEYVQIHPDAASFKHHLQVLADAETSYQDTLQATTAIRIYGTPTEQIMTTLRRSVGPDVQITILPTLLGGFSRR